MNFNVSSNFRVNHIIFDLVKALIIFGFDVVTKLPLSSESLYDDLPVFNFLSPINQLSSILKQ